MFVLGKSGAIKPNLNNESQVGNYACITSSNRRPWSSKPVIPKKKTTRKKKIIYPIFYECSTLTKDPFWKRKFEQAGYGKFPRGFSYYDGLLMYKRGIKNEATKIPTNNTEDAYCTSLYFFKQTANMYSDEDKKRLREEEHKLHLQERLKERTWAKASRRQREVLVDIYIQELTEKYNLSSYQSRKVGDLIYLGIFYNVLDKDVIHLEDGMISEIEGLNYDEGSGEFTLDQELKPKIPKSSSKAKKITPSPEPRHITTQIRKNMNFQTEWEKLLKTTIQNTSLKSSSTTKKPKTSKTKSKPNIIHIQNKQKRNKSTSLVSDGSENTSIKRSEDDVDNNTSSYKDKNSETEPEYIYSIDASSETET